MCGSRDRAFRRFFDAIDDAKAPSILLVDAEVPVASKNAWTHIEKTSPWKKPTGLTDDHAHLMVQSMEAWIIADAKGAAACFGKGWDPAKLKSTANVEGITTHDLLKRLKAATKDCSQPYEKGEISFRTLAVLEPRAVRNASPHADRLFVALARFLG